MQWRQGLRFRVQALGFWGNLGSLVCLQMGWESSRPAFEEDLRMVLQSSLPDFRGLHPVGFFAAAALL